MPYTARLKQFAALLLTAVLGLWLLSQLSLKLWQQQLQDKLQAPHSPLASAIAQASSDHQPQALTKAATLLISDIALPLPHLQSQPSAQLTNSSNAAPTLMPSVSAQPASLVSQNTTPVTQQTKHLTAQQIYQQLHTDKALTIQIALPTDATQHTQLLDYLYRCAATQFAVLQQTPQSPQLQYLSPKRYVTPSQWLRVVNGALSPQERQWLADNPGQAVRVFSHEVDQRLAAHIAYSLANKPLRSLRASYRLKPEGLYLSDIALNGQAHNTNWLLHVNQCARS